jgi:predicted DsbA family dithiol-disulfide isomerase
VFFIISFSSLVVGVPRDRASRLLFIAAGAPEGSSDNRGMDEIRPVRIDVWLDFACTFCRAQWATLEALRARESDCFDVEWHAFELRPEPARLEAGEPRTRLAHETVEFARDAGRGDDVRRAIFAASEAGRDIGSADVLVEVVAMQGLDGAALRDALHRNLFTARVVADNSLATRLGIRAVPMTIVRRPGVALAAGLGISGAADEEQVRRVIAKALTSS